MMIMWFLSLIIKKNNEFVSWICTAMVRLSLTLGAIYSLAPGKEVL